MPFGKFRGTALEDLPAHYIVWLSRRDLRDPLRARVVEELGRRVLLHHSKVVLKDPDLTAAVTEPEMHVGDVDQDGERMPF
jgi:putative quorum-sensing-regulated virulence factor